MSFSFIPPIILKPRGIIDIDSALLHMDTLFLASFS